MKSTDTFDRLRLSHAGKLSSFKDLVGMKRRLECERLEPRIALASDLFSVSPDGFWESRPRIPATQGLASTIQPTDFAAITLDVDAFASLLAAAPLEFSSESISEPLIITLPTPDHGFDRFAVVQSPLMEAEFASQFPDIMTFAGQGIDDPAATLRFDVSPAGFHAQVLSPNGAYYIDPFWHLDDSIYISYFKSDLPRRSDQLFIEESSDEHDHGVVSEEKELGTLLIADSDPNLPSNDIAALKDKIADAIELNASQKGSDGPQLLRSGTQLRTYRAAVAATAEYTAFHGGTVALGQAAIVTTMNRVSGIYELELGIRLVLVGNNSLLVYTNAATDPYTNGNPSQLLSQNQSNIDSIIGNANYDIGHVFSTGGGGLAGLGVVGITGQKARGETGTSAPIGDPFYVDYVAHEMGHQFGGNHTFNGTQGSCSGNSNSGTAYEPGSGTTIQAYAGICGGDDLQPNSDPYFHSVSFDEMIAYTTTGIGNAAASITGTLNNVPRVNAGADFVIPSRTPFVLSAAGVDIDSSDALTYNWEQRDLGAQQTVSAPDNGASPLFRSFNPTTNTDRVLPRITDLVNNTTVAGEKLPSVARNMRFRATVRDNRSGGGGVNTDDMQISVIDTGSAFAVTSPNTVSNWTTGSLQTVTWNVANTSSAPINSSNVNVHLSVDGGLTYPILLASNTTNDGSHEITVPDVATTVGRIRVESASNIFFDISNANITIEGSNNTAPTISSIHNQFLSMGTSTGAIPFTVNDSQTDAGSLIVTATSSNATLVPNANIVIVGSGSNRTISVLGASGQFGQATILVNATDANGLTTQESFIVMFEKVVVCTAYQSFDGVTVPSLPVGWTNTSSGASPANWVTSTSISASDPNNAFVSNPTNTSDSVLTSPAFVLTDSNSQIAFRNNYVLESTFDGGVLEISINGGAFTDILSAGGSFKAGGYNGTIDNRYANPISGRQAWTGSSGGYIDTIVDLPSSAIGSSVQLRWRMGSDNSLALTGWRVDSIQTCGVPSNSPPLIASTLAQVSGNVLTPILNTGTWADPESANVDLTASLGSIVKNANGTWNWSFTPSTIITNQTVTITATDAGNLVATSTFQLNATAYVSSSQVLYLNSEYFELFGVSGAVDTQKSFLRPGAQPVSTSMSNVVNYSRGLNGILLNIPGLAASSLSVPNDIVLRVAPDGARDAVTPSEWNAAPMPLSIGITAGTASTPAQVQIQWTNNTIQNTWLQIIVNANANTGLPSREVFYIGHAMGDVVGGAPYRVTTLDLSAVQEAISTSLVPIFDSKDFNKDRRVTTFDLSYVQERIATTVLLHDILVPASGSAGEGEMRGRNSKQSFNFDESVNTNVFAMVASHADLERFYSYLGRKKLPVFGI